MKTMILAMLSTVALVAAAVAQTLTVMPAGELQQKREAMQQALGGWEHTAPNLEAELFTRPRPVVEAAIGRAERAAAALSQARQGFYQALVGKLGEQVAILEQAGGEPDTSSVKANLDHKLRLLGNGDTELAKALEAAGGNDPKNILIHEQIQRQLNSAEQLRKNLAEQGKAAGNIEQNSKPLETARRTLLANYQHLQQVFQGELERTQKEDALWRAYYGGLRELVAQADPASENDTTAADSGNGGKKAAGHKTNKTTAPRRREVKDKDDKDKD